MDKISNMTADELDEKAAECGMQGLLAMGIGDTQLMDRIAVHGMIFNLLAEQKRLKARVAELEKAVNS